MTPQKLEPGFDSSAEDNISRLLSSMPRVEAPGDFGFRVKARIADRNSARGTFLWMPTAVKAAVPLGLAMFVGGYFAVTSFYVTDEAPPLQAAVETARPGLVQSVPAEPATEPVISRVVTAGPEEAKAAPTAQPREVAAKAYAKRLLTRKATTDTSEIGDYVEAASGPRKPSPSEDPAVKPEAPVKGTPAGEVLTRMGVNALFSEGGWKAESVSPNTAAAKAGVKAGDIIEAVDDQDLSDLGSVSKPATGKKLRVKRDGKSVEIVID